MSNLVLLIHQPNAAKRTLKEEFENTIGACDTETKELLGVVMLLSQNSAIIDMSEHPQAIFRVCGKLSESNQGYILVPISSAVDIEKWIVGGDALQEVKANLKKFLDREIAPSYKDRISSS